MIRPEDVQKQQFEVSFKGYKTREVDEFLDLIYTDLQELYTEMEALRRKVAAAELLAKDAKDHEEEFIASMQEDKAQSEAVLAAAKAEGERIIREAKNATAGIMAEVRRRAGDISAESRKASTDILDEAKAEAEKIRASAVAEVAAITDGAKAEAEKKLYAARTEADNIVKAARTEAESITSEANAEAEAVINAAAETAAIHEKYIREVRETAEKLCFEIDTELKNSASRIALLGKRISTADIPEMTPIVTETDDEDAVRIASSSTKTTEAPAHAVVPQVEESTETKETNETAEAKNKEDEGKTEAGPHGGYFSHEYRLAMAELFGEDADSEIPSSDVTEDDDTYDYLDHMNSSGYSMGSSDDDDDDDEGGDSNGVVTSEYTGIPTSSSSSSGDDAFTDDALDRIFRSPTQEEINDILNG